MNSTKQCYIEELFPLLTAAGIGDFAAPYSDGGQDRAPRGRNSTS